MFLNQFVRTGAAIFAVIVGATAGSNSAFAGDRSKNASAVTPAAYQSFRADIAAISTMRLDRPKNVEKARKLLSSYDEVALSRGFVAEFSSVALRSDKFRKGINRAARKNGGAKRFAAELKANPNAVLKVGGWEAGAREVAAIVNADTNQMASLAYRLNEVAYGRTSQEASLARAGGVTSSLPSKKVKTATPLMTRILALGALMELEGVKAVSARPALSAYTADASHDQCLRWARLNINQCLAAAGTNEETAYCLSTQALAEREKCWTGIGGAS